VVLGSVVVDLVDRYRGVHDVWLDGLLVDDRLDGLVDVVVDVLAGDDWRDGAGVLALNTLLLVAELGLLDSEAALHIVGVVVLIRTVLDRDNVVVVLLWELSLVVDRLHGGVVVVLVHLLVDSGLDVLVLGAVHGLVSDGRSDLLVDGVIMVTGLGHEVLNGGFGGVHCDGVA